MKGHWVRPRKGDASVVFVHGLLSSAEAWRHENGAHWPTLVTREPALEPLGVYVFSYESAIFSGTYRLGDVVDALKEQLRLDGVLKSERLVFVCHSMGGIVARKFVVERAIELVELGVQVGLFMVASPSLGSSYANWLRPLARFLNHAQADALRFTQDNAWLNDLDKEFLNLKEAGRIRIRGKELIEDRFVMLRWLWRRQVVEPFSGARYFGEAMKIPNSDHFSIAKPENELALQHRLLVGFLLDFTKDLPPDLRGPAPAGATDPPQDPLARFASRIRSLASWEDLVLPEEPRGQVQEFADAAASQVLQSEAGPTTGLLALFHGPPGTGKRLAARVIAGYLEAELHAVNYTDLVVSDQGGTAKNLRQLSTAVAARGAWLLLHDVELLFPAKGVHNAPLLAELGCNVILTTTSLAEVDRRVVDHASYVVRFPFPDEVSREYIWRGTFPPEVPISIDVDMRALAARYPLSGADIKRAFDMALERARRGAGPVTMAHLDSAASRLMTRSE
jgi:pimeloyl-ACP methyl ester carboxylesterase